MNVDVLKLFFQLELQVEVFIKEENLESDGELVVEDGIFVKILEIFQ